MNRYNEDSLTNFLKKASEKNKFPTIHKAVNNSETGGYFTLRCDVERDLEHQLQFARTISAIGIAATFYFHTRETCYERNTMREIEGLGHEIGFHHECLDRCNGDFFGARELFLREVDFFRRDGFQITTVCSHGENGIQKIGYKANCDLFKKYPNLLKEAGIQAEVFHWAQNKGLNVIQDTLSGYSSMESFLHQNTPKAEIPHMIGIHPHRWRKSKIKSAIEITHDISIYLKNKIYGKRKYKTVI